jgi:hypothetical protein
MSQLVAVRKHRPMAVWGGRTGQMTFEFETMSQSPRYVVCRCQYCDGGIEFDASDFELSETRNVECPHCRLETRIFVPATAPKPDLSNPIQPSTAACSPPAQTFLLTIGRIGITSDRVVTPSGTVELAGSQWCFLNMSKVEYSSSAFSDAKPSHLRGIPLPILLLMCFFSALSRKATISGYAEVSVLNGIFHYKTQIPINSHADLNRIRELVNKAQSLAT